MAERVRHWAVAGTVTAVLLGSMLTACGSDSTSEPSADPTTSPAATATASATESTTAPSTQGASPATSTAKASLIPGADETAAVAAGDLGRSADEGEFCEAFIDIMRDTATAPADSQEVQLAAYKNYVARLVQLGSTPEMDDTQRAGMLVFINLVRGQSIDDVRKGVSTTMGEKQNQQFSAFAEYRLKACNQQLEALNKELTPAS